MPPPIPPQPVENEKVVVDYFIDEAGDPVLFGKRKVIVGTQSSRYFILGELEIDDPADTPRALLSGISFAKNHGISPEKAFANTFDDRSKTATDPPRRDRIRQRRLAGPQTLGA